MFLGVKHGTGLCRTQKKPIMQAISRGLGNAFKTQPLVIDDTGKLRERDTGRVFHMNGINFASNTKLPHYPCQHTHLHPDVCGLYDSADTISFVGKPFPIHQAFEHISRIKQCGYNTIRLVTTWESLEHEGPGIYDLDYVEYLINILKVIDEMGGLYVIIDPHQDVWSRFSGGSGAPIWTLYAAGLEPRHFEETMAAKLHNMSKQPEDFTRMVWATNYNRLASNVMFTMFFSGSIYLPKAVIDDVNIQQYLQDHFIEAYAFLMDQIKERIPEVFRTCLLGIESMNEPNSGYFGFSDLNSCPPDQNLKLDETPTPIQAFRLGMGIPEHVDTYSLSIVGPTKSGSTWIDPQGIKAWVTEEESKDKHYGFNRSSQWKLGECIFAQHGVWDIQTTELVIADYFKVHPETGEYLDEKKFINGSFLDFWYKFKTRMRKIDDEMFLIVQGPVLQIPPRILNDTKYVDDKTMVALHYYDGMSLMFQKWNRLMNVDTLGIMRGRYLNPVFGIILGETNIRKSIRKQLKEMANESYQNVGFNVPVVFTETGMPFNMDNKKSFENGDYNSQESANDAILSGLENEQLNFTYWCYNPENCHQWGDFWNLEDFSVYSKDDSQQKEFLKFDRYEDWVLGNATSNPMSPPTTVLMGAGESDSDAENNDNNNNSDSLSTSDRSTSGLSMSKSVLREITHSYMDRGVKREKFLDLSDGIRAPNAIIRPSPYLVNGEVRVCEYNVSNKLFHLEILSSRPKVNACPDIIILPKVHYRANNSTISVSHGCFKLKQTPIMQWLEWDHNDVHGKLVTLDVALKDNEIFSASGEISGLKGLACGYL